MQSLERWRVSHLMRAAVVILHTCFLVDCSAALQTKLGAADSAPDATTRAVGNADFSAHFPIPIDQVPDRQAPETSKPLLFPGAESESPPTTSRDSDYLARTALVEPATIRGDDEMNFENADISSAAKAVLGDVLHVNSRDPKVLGTVTLASVRPIPREELPPTFEGVLRMQNGGSCTESPKVRVCSSRRPNGRHLDRLDNSGITLKYGNATKIAETFTKYLRVKSVVQDQ
jgi:hypothetical protein